MVPLGPAYLVSVPLERFYGSLLALDRILRERAAEAANQSTTAIVDRARARWVVGMTKNAGSQK